MQMWAWRRPSKNLQMLQGLTAPPDTEAEKGERLQVTDKVLWGSESEPPHTHTVNPSFDKAEVKRLIANKTRRPDESIGKCHAGRITPQSQTKLALQYSKGFPWPLISSHLKENGFYRKLWAFPFADNMTSHAVSIWGKEHAGFFCFIL